MPARCRERQAVVWLSRFSPHFGRSLSDFQLTKQLYKGKASTLYLAVDKPSGMTVALKSYSKRRLSSLNWFQVEREVRLHAQLRHPSIIALHAAFEDDNYVFMVTEYAEGEAGRCGHMMERAGVLGCRVPVDAGTGRDRQCCHCVVVLHAFSTYAGHVGARLAHMEGNSASCSQGSSAALRLPTACKPACSGPADISSTNATAAAEHLHLPPPGGDLYEDLKRAGGQMRERVVAGEVLPPFMAALAFMHSNSIVHRDIKPENILLTADRAIKVGGSCRRTAGAWLAKPSTMMGLACR